MLLKEALETHKKSKGKIDILELLGIEINKQYCENQYYKNKIKNLKKGDYFISDLDGTFFRGTLIKEAFSVFAKYLRDFDIEKINLERYKEFLDDLIVFRKIEKDAYNKKIAFTDYLNSGLFLIYKYQNLINWADFLAYLKDYFHKHEKVNSFRFSIKKMTEILKDGNQFLFLSGASDFVFEIYLELLKDYVGKNIGKKYIKQIHGISSHIDFDKKQVYNVWNQDGKFSFLEELNKKGIIDKIIGGMGDTTSDYGIANHIKSGDFYFMNPAYNVLQKHNKLHITDINYHFITERKDLIFEYDIENIEILN